MTKVGEVELNVPRLRSVPFTTAAIERYRRRESSIEEALVEIYMAGVSTRRVSDVTEMLFGVSVFSSAMSDLNKKVYERLEEWRSRPLQKKHPYVYLNGMVMSRRWTGEELISLRSRQHRRWESASLQNLGESLEKSKRSKIPCRNNQIDY